MVPAGSARTTVVFAFAFTLAACGENNRYAAPPPPKVTVAAPVEQDVTRYFDATGNTAAVNSVDLVARVAGLRAGDQLQRRRLCEKGHVAVHHRARALQAEGSKQASCDHERRGDADAGPGRIPAPGRSHYQAGIDPGQLRQGAGAARFRASRSAIGAGQREAGRDQSRLYRCDGAVRRRRHRAAGIDRPICRRQLDADGACHHRAARSDLGEFQRQRARCAASRAESGKPRRNHRRSLLGIPVEVGLQTEDGYPHEGKLDYVAPTVNPVDRHACGPRDLAERQSFPVAWLFRARAHSVASRSRRCWCRTSRSAAIRAAAMCSSSTRTMSSSSAKSNPVSSSANLRVIDKGLTKDDRVVVGGIMRAIPGQKVDAEQGSVAAAN